MFVRSKTRFKVDSLDHDILQEVYNIVTVLRTLSLKDKQLRIYSNMQVYKQLLYTTKLF